MFELLGNLQRGAITNVILGRLKGSCRWQCLFGMKGVGRVIMDAVFHGLVNGSLDGNLLLVLVVVKAVLGNLNRFLGDSDQPAAREC